MELDFTDDDGFTAFQFYWFALIYRSQNGETPQRLKQEYDLKSRMEKISLSQRDGGRILKEPTLFPVTDDERLTLLSAMTETSWTPGVFPQVLHAVTSLGYRPEVKFVPNPSVLGHAKTNPRATSVRAGAPDTVGGNVSHAGR